MEELEELVEEIKENQVADSSEQAENQDVADITWLIFSVNEKQFAIEAPMAKEILRNMDIYPLPFVPDFIKGVINRHGDPYTVVDLALFLGDMQQESSLFIVLNLQDNQFCVQITDILDFHTAPENTIIHINDVQDAGFFSGTIEYNGKNIPIIEADKIYNFIRTNLES